MANQLVVIEHDRCRNCGADIAREPFQPSALREWIWQWVHEKTARTGCDKVLFAEPANEPAARTSEKP